MPQLRKTKKGWQNEHFAKAILSEFSFVAEPVTVSDDFGFDFFCTSYNIEKGMLNPGISFAVQNKSNTDPIKLKSLKYLNDLMVPFFVSVVNKANKTLSIYSGECLSSFFSYKGDGLKNVYIKLVENRAEILHHEGEKNKYILEFPKVAELESDFDYEKNPDKLKDLFKVCNLMRENLLRRKNSSYLLKRYNEQIVEFYAGPGSVSSYRLKVLDLLAEVFFNLEYLHNTGNDIRIEFKIYEALYSNLSLHYGTIPQYLGERYLSVKKIIDDGKLSK